MDRANPNLTRSKATAQFIRPTRDEISGLGLDHFEVRSWRGFHHHVALVMLAYGFLALEQERAKRRPTGPGKRRVASR